MIMRLLQICTLSISLFFMSAVADDAIPVFIVKPYLQIGPMPDGHSLDVLWQTADEDAGWLLETSNGNNNEWIAAGKPDTKLVIVPGSDKIKLYTVALTGLAEGKPFRYRLKKNNKIVFTATGKAPKNATQPYRLIVTGDMGSGSEDARLLSEQAMLAAPDMMLVAGDLVYERGLISEYSTKFWPVYNADSLTHSGSPLMRSVPIVGAPGNHDTDTWDLDKHPDAMAYYLFWDQPLNGPAITPGGKSSPVLKMSETAKELFMKAAGSRFPRMSNFSFNYGNAHWTVLDSNPWVDWTDSSLVKWVENDIAAAKDATWKFVLFHHAGFFTSKNHWDVEHMRLLSPVFEKNGVDIVFAGHKHNYQRSYPLLFAPDKKGLMLASPKTDPTTIKGWLVDGHWTLDKTFDGRTNTRAKGIIYIVTGAGGAHLDHQELTTDTDSWQRFTYKMIADQHSISVIDINDRKFTMRQINPAGTVIDSLTVTK